MVREENQVMYVCETCGKVYGAISPAQKCEELHKIASIKVKPGDIIRSTSDRGTSSTFYIIYDVKPDCVQCTSILGDVLSTDDVSIRTICTVSASEVNRAAFATSKERARIESIGRFLYKSMTRGID